MEDLVLNAKNVDEAADEKKMYRETNIINRAWKYILNQINRDHDKSPLSSQGLLVFGGITSAYALKRD